MLDQGEPLVELVDVEKRFSGAASLRIARLAIHPGDRFVLAGLDAGAAESLVHLLTGAAVPDVGDVRVAGRSTRDVTTDTEWLASLDRFGLVTARAVLLDGLAVAANLALPLTIAIDPMTDEVRAKVDALARLAGLDLDVLDRPAASLDALGRMRAHLARALAVDSRVLLLEHPTAALDPAGAAAFGADLRRAADARGLAWLAISNDDGFARAAGGTRLRHESETGALRPEAGGWMRRLWTRARR